MVSHVTEPRPTPESVQGPSASPRPATTAPAMGVHRSGSFLVAATSPAELGEEQLQGWRQLYAAQPAPANPFLSPTWTLQWYDKYVRAEDQVVLVVRRVGEDDQEGPVVAVAPMHLHRPRVGPLPLARRLLPVGAGVGPTAYEIPGLLCAEGSAGQVVRALVSTCLELPVDWAELALSSEQGWLDNQWLLNSPRATSFSEFARPRACLVLPLQDTWESTRAALKRNIKESIRRSANRLKKDGRPVEVVRRSTDLDRATVERFLALHQARAAVTRSSRRHPDSYADDRNRRLVLEALPVLGPEGGASMFELYLDGVHVASQLALHAAGTSYVHSSGFREDTWSLGVTTHLQAELVRHAIARGDRIVNFSPGPNVSKTRWSEQLWVTHEFAFGAGPRALTARFAAFQMLSSLRVTLDAASRHRSQLGPAQG